MVPRPILLLLLLSMPVAHADDVARQALRATVRVSDGTRSGAGFIVALPRDGAAPEHLLVTAAHVLANNQAATCSASFRAAVGPAGFERREVRIPIREGGRPLWEKHPGADVAVIAVVPPADADLGSFVVEDLADRARIESGVVAAGRRVWVACFPAQLESNRAGWPILRQGTIASHPLLPLEATPTIFLDYSHFGGDSGAAAVLDDGGRPVVVGVVVGMQRQTDRITSPFEERTTHTPLGLAITVQAALVRDTIEAWSRKRSEGAAAR